MSDDDDDLCDDEYLCCEEYCQKCEHYFICAEENERDD